MAAAASVTTVAVLALAACGNAPTESRPRMPQRTEPVARVEAPARPQPESPPPDAGVRAWATDADLDAYWRSLGIDGENWRERVESIPPEHRHAMASHLLRHGSFRCWVAVTDDGCGVRSYFIDPAPTADVDDACLRRDIAFWALDQIDEDNIDGELYDAFIRIISLDAPERDLNQHALGRLTPGSWMAENALWEAMSADNDAFVEANLEALPQGGLARAGRDYHIDGALLAVAPTEDPDLYIDGLNDFQLRAETRLEIAERLVALHAQRDLGHAIREKIELEVRTFGNLRGTDCAAAGVAARLLDDPASVAKRRARTEDEVAELACLALHAAGPRGKHWRRIITRHELTVVNHLEDRFHDPPAWEETKVHKPGAFFLLPFASELERALPHCDDGICHVPDSDVYFELEIRRERNSGLRIHTIHRHEKRDNGC